VPISPVLWATACPIRGAAGICHRLPHDIQQAIAQQATSNPLIHQKPSIALNPLELWYWCLTNPAEDCRISVAVTPPIPETADSKPPHRPIALLKHICGGVVTDRNHFGCRFQRGELRSRRLVLHAPEPPPINPALGSAFHPGGFWHPHPEKVTRIDLNRAGSSKCQAAFKSR